MTRSKDKFASDQVTFQPVEDLDPEHWDVRQQTAIILDILCHFLTGDRVSQLKSWCDHVGFDITALSQTADFGAAWLGHYRQGRGYSVERAISDYLSWTSLEKQATWPSPTPGRDGNRSRKESSNRFGKPSE